MHVGMCSIFQNPGNAISDQRVYSNEVDWQNPPNH